MPDVSLLNLVRSEEDPEDRIPRKHRRGGGRSHRLRPVRDKFLPASEGLPQWPRRGCRRGHDGGQRRVLQDRSAL